jgi:hypothetical protein
MSFSPNGFSFVSIPASSLCLTRQGSADHGRRAPYTAIYRDSAGGAVELAGPTFHAGFRMRERDRAAVASKYGVRTDRGAHLTADAQFGLVLECIRQIRIEHGYAPKIRRTYKASVATMPIPNIQAMTGM